MTALDYIWNWTGRWALKLLALVGEEEAVVAQEEIMLGSRPCASITLTSKHFEVIEDTKEALIGGSIYINGKQHHLMGLKVVDKDGEWVPVHDPDGWYDSVCALDQIKFGVTEIEGLDGLWILWTHPAEH